MCVESNTKESLKKISVIIPCFNSGATIERTISSVKLQSYPNVEIIVVDDGSTDSSTIDILNNLGGVNLIRQDNFGLSSARNTGVRAASGSLIFPLDADDWIKPETLTLLNDALMTNSHASFSFSHIQLEGEANGILQKNYNYFEQLFLNQIPYSILIHKDVCLKLGGYDDLMKNGYEDWEFNIRLGANGYHGIPIALPLFHYTVSRTGMLLSRSTHLHGELWGFIQKKNLNVFRGYSLLKLWWSWRKEPSTYPLALFFLWQILFKILPNSSFSVLFRKLRKYSHTQRISR